MLKKHAKIIHHLRIRRSQATQESRTGTSGRQARQECNATGSKGRQPGKVTTTGKSKAARQGRQARQGSYQERKIAQQGRSQCNKDFES